MEAARVFLSLDDSAVADAEAVAAAAHHAAPGAAAASAADAELARVFNWLDDDKQSGAAQDSDGIDSWHGPPEVCVGRPRGLDCSLSSPLPSGTYTMFEYYPSGDPVLSSGQTMSLECSVETITGRGDDVTGEFEVRGGMDGSTGEWVLSIVHPGGGGECRTYCGLQDAAPGLWGLSQAVRSTSTLSRSTTLPPRPFRMWHTPGAALAGPPGADADMEAFGAMFNDMNVG